ncbi:MAG: DUF4339 domain-containing protein [Verrucomicrobiota bacterium]
MNWFYQDAGGEKYNFDDEKFFQMVSGNIVGPKTMVWTNGMKEWLPASEARPEFFGGRAEDAPPDVPRVEVKGQDAPPPAPPPTASAPESAPASEPKEKSGSALGAIFKFIIILAILGGAFYALRPGGPYGHLIFGEPNTHEAELNSNPEPTSNP